MLDETDVGDLSNVIVGREGKTADDWCDVVVMVGFTMGELFHLNVLACGSDLMTDVQDRLTLGSVTLALGEHTRTTKEAAIGLAAIRDSAAAERLKETTGRSAAFGDTSNGRPEVIFRLRVCFRLSGSQTNGTEPVDGHSVSAIRFVNIVPQCRDSIERCAHRRCLPLVNRIESVVKRKRS